jgi:hypothetical protein
MQRTAQEWKMTNPETDKILDKVRKLLALSTSDNVHEAANAAARAQDLIDNYNIDAALLGDPKGGPENPPQQDDEQVERCEDLPLFESKTAFATWKWNLAWALGKHNHCRPWSTRGWAAQTGYVRKAFLVGRRSDAQAAQVLFWYVSAEVERLADQHRGKGRTWLNNFRLGAVSEVERRLRQERNEKTEERRSVAQAAGGGALVRLETALVRFAERGKQAEDWMRFHGMKYSSGGGGSRHNSDAFMEGRRAGAGISLGAGRRALKE